MNSEPKPHAYLSPFVVIAFAVTNVIKGLVYPIEGSEAS
jgi:hypothetical protein